MKQSEFDKKNYEIKSYMVDKFRDIQMQAQALKNVEDVEKVKKILIKISDFISEIRRGYTSLEELSKEIIEPDENDMFYDVL